MANFQQSMTINVRANGAKDAATQIREVSRSVFEAKTLLNVPLKLRLNVSDFEAQARRTKSGLDSLTQSVRMFRTLIFGAGVERFAAGIVNGIDALTNLENKIKVTLKANEDLGFTMSRVLAIANQTRTGIGDIATVYSRTARSVEILGVSQSATLEFTKILNQAIKVGGSTSEEASNSMIQLSQGLASGALKGDELRSVLEGLPVVSKLIADSMGVTVGQLRQLGAEGKITADKVFVAILKGGEDMEKQFAKMQPTFEQSWEVFQNTWMMGLKMFQPLVEGTTKVLTGLIKTWDMLGDAMQDVFKVWVENRDEGFFGQVAAVFGGARGRDWAPTDTNRMDVVKRLQKEREQEIADEDMIQKGEAMADMYDLIYHPPKMPPQKGHKEGGLTFEELMYKVGQENELASMEPENQAVAKEFFEKLGRLKKSIREDLVTHAGKGGRQDEQLQQLQDMIRAEHERQSNARIQYQLEDELYKMQQEQQKRSIELGKEEEKQRAANTKRIYESDLAIKASLDPLNDYNKEIEKFNDYLHRHPEDIEKVTAQVDKLGYAYETFAPIFQQMSDGLADAAGNAIVFGNNFASALKQIAQASAASMISSLIKTGISALIGTPMAGVNGGNPLTPVAPVKGAARGGYMPGYEFGGYTGSYARGDIAGVVHGQEFVVNANATARNRALLESMNAGKPVGAANVNIHNYAGVAVEATANNNGDIEVMIHKAIAERAPMAVAQDLRNRNGRVSKALRQNYEVTSRN